MGGWIIKLITGASAIFLLTRCDPYYSITITNTTDDTSTILVKENIHFRTEKQKDSTTGDGFDVYKLDPKEEMQVGSAIGGLDNDIPFHAITIIKKKDTISANDLESIKKLFDKTLLGGLQTPYNISIK